MKAFGFFEEKIWEVKRAFLGVTDFKVEDKLIKLQWKPGQQLWKLGGRKELGLKKRDDAHHCFVFNFFQNGIEDWG